MTHSILLRGGHLVDGTGTTPGARADVLVQGELIAAIDQHIDVGESTEIIDATGRVVCPGFIDIHSHADFTLIAFPGADSAIRQGITTVAVGNCGAGVAPTSKQFDVRDVAFAFISEWGIDIDWSGFGDYTTNLDGAAINVAPLVAHGAIRNAVMGLEARPATPAELERMEDMLRAALDDGAFGMSTGLQYLPGSWASAAEIRALVEIVGRSGRTYATHMRNRADSFISSTKEALDAADRTDARLQLSHFAPRPYAPPAQTDGAFTLIDRAVAAGRPVGIDTFPEVWGPALLVDLFPAEVMTGTVSEVLQRLSDESTRTHIDAYFDEGSAFLARVAGYEQIYLTGIGVAADRIGQSLTDLAATAGKTIGQTSCDMLLEADHQYRSVGIRHIYATEDDLRRTLQLPYCSIESDGIITSGEGVDCPLSWNASSYGYTARVLEHYVDHERFFTLEEAIHKMTQLPALALGLGSRGVLAVGNNADIVVFDPETITDRTTPDDMARHPKGIDHVLVNGHIAIGRSVGNGHPVRAGRLLQP